MALRRRRSAGGALEVEVPGLAHDTLHFVGRVASEVNRDAFILVEGDGPDGPLGQLARPELQHAVPEERSRRFFSTCRHVCLMYSQSPGFPRSTAPAPSTVARARLPRLTVECAEKVSIAERITLHVRGASDHSRREKNFSQCTGYLARQNQRGKSNANQKHRSYAASLAASHP